MKKYGKLKKAFSILVITTMVFSMMPSFALTVIAEEIEENAAQNQSETVQNVGSSESVENATESESGQSGEAQPGALQSDEADSDASQSNDADAAPKAAGGNGSTRQTAGSAVKMEMYGYTYYYDDFAEAFEDVQTDLAEIILLKDVTVSSCQVLTSISYVYLDLNGHTITYTGSANSPVFQVTSKASFFIVDRSTGKNGKITGGKLCGIYNTGTLELWSGSIYGNNAQYGGVYNSGRFTLKGGSISNNISADNGGGVYQASKGSFTMTGGTISNNTSAYSGAGIMAYGPVTIKDGTISGNKASGSTGWGGGIYGCGSKCSITINGGTISGNSATKGAGGVDGYNLSSFTMTGGTISGNTANIHAGLYAESDFTMTGGTISGNAATAYGGGIGVNGGKVVTMSGGTISNNTARDGAGACVFGTFNLSGNGTVSGNTASNNGGGIYSQGTINISGGTISNNKAGNKGGGCLNVNGTTLNLTGGSISGNTAAYGGGIRVEGTCTISGGEISNNTASNSGGGISNLGDTEVTGGSISGNSAPNGAGIASCYYTGANLVLAGGTISENKASNSGGGLRVESNCTISGATTISGNTAAYAAGVYAWGTVNMTGGTISGNKATKSGGGVYQRETFNMTGGTISGNEATWGGGVYQVSNFTMTGGTVSGNTAKYGGGVEQTNGIMTVGGTAQIKSNTYNGNANNLYILENTTVTVSKEVPLEQGAEFGITTDVTPTSASPVNITGANNVNCISYFNSDNSYYKCENTGSGSNQVIVLKAAHEHNWTYALSNNNKTITASCTDGCTYTGTDKTLTIAAPASTAYDGTAHNASFGTATTFCGGALPTISYGYNAATAGSYTATTDTTKPGYYKASFTAGSGSGAKTGCVEYQVTKGTPAASDFTFTAPTNTVADGSVKTATVEPKSGITGMGEVKITYYSDANYTKKVTNPTDAGTYYVGITVKAGDNYKASTSLIKDSSWQFTLSQAVASVTVGTTTTYYTSITDAWTYAKNNSPATVTLLANVSGNLTNASGKNITLDLNGYVLKGTGASNTNVIEVNSSTLTLTDSGATTQKHYFTYVEKGQWQYIESPDTTQIQGAVDFEDMESASLTSGSTVIAISGGIITGGVSHAVMVGDSGVLNFNGGTIAGNTGSWGVGLNLSTGSSGTCTISGGNIIGNHSSVHAGAAINCDGGNGVSSLTLNSGCIAYNSYTGNTSAATGIIRINNHSTFSMTGGLISNNYCNVNGVIAVVGSYGEDCGSTATITGGQIVNNSSVGDGAGIYLERGTLTLGGTVKISGNKKGTADNNLYLASGKTVSISTATPLTQGASIGVTTAASPTVNISGNNDTDYSGYFTSDVEQYSTTNSDTTNNIVQLINHKHNWTYSLSNDKKTVSATCTASGCPGVGDDTSLTISAPESLVYDGNSHNAAFDKTTFCGSSTLPAISYEYKAKKSDEYAAASDTKSAGYYRASFTVGSGDAAKTAFVEYHVTKATPTAADFDYTAPSGDLMYNEQPKAATVEAKSGVTGIGEGITVSYYSDEDCTKEVDPVNAGTYYVGIAVTEGTNYKAGTETIKASEWKFTITPAAASVTIGTTTTYYNKLETAWSAAQNAGTATVKMLANASGNLTNASGKNITLDLNGYVLKGTGASEKNIIEVNSSTLTLTDSGATAQKHYFTYVEKGQWIYIESPTTAQIQGAVDFEDMESASLTSGSTVIAISGGIITGGVYHAIRVGSSGTLNFNGGTIAGNTGNWGVALELDKGNVIVDGGDIIGNCAIGHGEVAANVDNNSTLTLKNGSIAYNSNTSTNTDGVGAIRLNRGSAFTMTGGKIHNNYGNMGGGALASAHDDSCRATITGGEIFNNYCGSGKEGGGIYFKMGMLTLGGTVKISGNKKGTADNNLYLASGKTVSISTETPLNQGASIGVTTAATPSSGSPVAITTATNSADYSSYFTSDNSNYKAYNYGSNTSQVVKLSLHEHTWTYAADGDTLKAWCVEEHGHSNCSVYGKDKAQTVKINLPTTGLTYDGNAKTATLSGNSFGELTVDANNIKYQKKNGSTWENIDSAVDAGTYRASITAGSGDTAITASVDFTIEKRKVTLWSESASKKYTDGSALTKPTVYASSTKDDVDSVFTSQVTDLKATGSVSTVADSPVANTITYTAGTGFNADNYQISISEGMLAVTPGELGIVCPSFNGVYDGKEHGEAPTLSVTVGTTLECWTSDDYDPKNPEEATWKEYSGKTAPTIKEVGTLWVKVKGYNDNCDPKEYTCIYSLTVTPAPLVVTTASASKTYDGTALTAKSGAKITGLVNNETATIEGTGTLTDVNYSKDGAVTSADNTYEITWGTAKEGNYSITDNLGTLTVTKRAVTLTSDSGTKTYDGTALSVTKVTAKGFVDGQGATYSDFASITNVGTTKNSFKYAMKDGTLAGNYEVSKVEGELKVTKETPVAGDFSFTAQSDLTYSGTAKTATVKFKGADDKTGMGAITVSYYDSKGNKLDSAPVNAGKYSVKIDVADGTNYEAATEITADSWNFTITKKKLTIKQESGRSTTTASNKTYDSTTDATVTAGELVGVVEGQSVGVSAAGSFGDKNVGEDKDVTVKYTLTGDAAVLANYIAPVDETVQASITAKALSVTGTTADNKKYDGDATATVNAGSLVGAETGDDVTIDSVTGEFADIKVGTDKAVTVTYTLKGTDKDNYNLSNPTDVKADITPKTAKIKIDSISALTYNGKAQEPTVVVRDASGNEIEASDYSVSYEDNVNAGKATVKVTGNNGYATLSAERQFTIDKRDVKFTADSDTKTYNGENQTLTSITVGSDELVQGHTHNVVANVSAMLVGEHYGTITDEDKVVIKDANDTDVTANYTITTVAGCLNITKPKTEIVITANSKEKTYDGTALSNNEYTFTDGVLVEGDALTAVVEGSITNAGETTNAVTSYKIMHGETDVTSCYKFSTVDGKLTVNKRVVNLYSDTVEKTYDGLELTAETVYGSEEKGAVDSVFASEVEGLTATGSISFVDKDDAGKGKSSVSNAITYSYKDGFSAKNYDITKHEGKLTINKVTTPITITAESDTKAYDGTALVNGGYTYTNGVIAATDELTAVVSGTITNVGTADNNVASYKVVNGRTDVTHCYTFTESVKGTLEVTKRSVTFTSASDNKNYDGTALTNSEVQISGDGFIKGEGVTFNVTGTQTYAGNSDNTFTYKLNDGTNADNYNIRKVEGQLVVSPSTAVVTITANSNSKTYDGTELKDSGYTVAITDVDEEGATIEGHLADGDELTAVVVEGSITKAGTAANTVTSYKIMRGDKDVSDCYPVAQCIDGTLTINPATPTADDFGFTAPSDLTYDGTAKKATVEFKGTGDKTGMGEITVNYYDSNGIKLESAPVNAGKYTVKIDVAAGDNYEAATEITAASWNFTIDRKQLTIEQKRGKTTTTAADKTYDSKTDATVTAGKLVGIVGEENVGVSAAGTFGDKKVGTNKDVTVVYTLTGDAAVIANYIAPENDTVKASITAKPLSTTGTTANNKIYDGKTTATVNAGSLVGVETGDYVTIDSVTGEFANIEVGTGKAVSVTYTLSGADKDNYEFTNPTDVTADITPKTATISIDSIAALTYNGKEQKPEVVVLDAAGNAIDAEDYTVSYENNVNAGKATVKVVGKNGYATLSAERQFTIDKRQVTLFSETVTKAYDGTPLTAETVYGSDSKGDVDSVFASEVQNLRATGSVTYAKDSPVKNSISYEFKSGFTADNYDITTNEGTLTVTPAEEKITITANSDVKVYDGETLTDDGYEFTQGVLLDGDELTVVVDGSITDIGAATNRISSYKVMRGTVDVTDCYNIETEDGVLQVTSPAKSDVRVDTEALAEVLKDFVEKYDDPEKYPEYAGKQFAVEFRTDEEVEAAESEYVASKLAEMGLSDKKTALINAELWLVVSDADGVIDELDIGDENETPVTATYTFDFTKKMDIRIFRLHTDSSGAKSFGEISSKPNELGEYIEIDEDAGTITVCACKYSTFAVAYTEVKDADTGDSNDMLPYAMLLMFSVIGIAGCGMHNGRKRGMKRRD